MQTNLRPIASLLLGVTFLLAGNGLQFTLLPLRGQVDGFSALALGFIGSAYYAGFVVGCVLAPNLILRAGHIRAFTALVAMAAVVALAYPLANLVVAWVLFRLVNGFCIAGFYLVIESWLNDRATNETRGLVMSSYIIVNYLAFTVGQLMVTIYPVTASEGFMLAAMLASLAIVPVALTRSAQPAPITMFSFRPMQLYHAAPVGLVATLMVGLSIGSFLSLGPLSARGNGLDVGQVALFMGMATLAGAITQWPVGRLSDRHDRRMVLLVLLIGAAATGFLLWLFAASGPLLLMFGFVFGAFALPGYSLAAAHAYDKTPVSDTVSTAATLLLANAMGATIGPLLAPLMMSALGPRALFLFIAVIQLLLAAYVFYRTLVMRSLSLPEKTEFEFVATSPVGGVVTSELPDVTDDSVVVPEPYEPGTTGDETTRSP
jgi:MFS family permease